jgi:hypothetical protein
VPASAVSIIPFKSGYVHPCEASVPVSKDLNVELELMPAGNLDTSNPPDPMAMHSRVTGTVLEMTADGPTLLAGAYVWFETVPDLVVADTLTDLNGRFTLCDLTGGSVYAGKNGYESSRGSPALPEMTILLKRQ